MDACTATTARACQSSRQTGHVAKSCLLGFQPGCSVGDNLWPELATVLVVRPCKYGVKTRKPQVSGVAGNPKNNAKLQTAGSPY